MKDRRIALTACVYPASLLLAAVTVSIIAAPRLAPADEGSTKGRHVEPRDDEKGVARALREIRDLRERVATLQRQLELTSTELAGLRAVRSTGLEDLRKLFRRSDGLTLGETRSAALEGIQLGADPTRAEVEEYVHRIVDVSKAKRSFSDADPQVAMLTRVGRKYLDALIDELAESREFGAQHHLIAAIERIATREDLPLILDALAWEPKLVEVVLEKGWEEDAREVLIAGLGEASGYLPTEWIKAVARLGDPSTYPALAAYLRDGSNRRWTYEAVHELDGFDLDDAVAAAWRVLATDSSRDRGEFSDIALAHGHFDALEIAVESLDTVDRWRARDVRTALRKHAGVRGSTEEIARWFREHRERFEWDAATRRWNIAVAPVRATKIETEGAKRDDGAGNAAPRIPQELIEGLNLGEMPPEVAEELRRALESAFAEGDVFIQRLPTRDGPDRRALEALVLPPDPSKEEARKYVKEILALSAQQRSWSTSDQQPRLLAQIGRDHLDVLLDAGSVSAHGPQATYLAGAVERLVKPSDRDRIVASLRDSPWLVRVIRKNGWSEAAREILLEWLTSSRSPGVFLFLDQEWLAAIVDLHDAATYPGLIHHLKRSQNPHHDYKVIAKLPDIELDDAVATIWRRSADSDPSGVRFSLSPRRADIAPIALAHGQLEALEYVIHSFASPKTSSRSRREFGRAIRRYTPARGSAEEILEWFEETRDRLNWSAEERAWTIVEERDEGDEKTRDGKR